MWTVTIESDLISASCRVAKISCNKVLLLQFKLMLCYLDLNGLVLVLFSFRVNKTRYILNQRIVSMICNDMYLGGLWSSPSQSLQVEYWLERGNLIRYLYMQVKHYLHNIPSQCIKDNNLYKLSVNVQQIICMQGSYTYDLSKFHDFPWLFPWRFEIFHDRS